MQYEAFKQAEVEGWNARAEAYDSVTGLITTQAVPTLLAMAETAPGHTILDLCCGTGSAVGAAAALGARAEGIDASPQMIAVARNRFPGVRFEIGDAEAVPRADESYDAVLCSFGLLHVGDPAAMLGEIARVLKPGGRAALSHWVGPPDSPFFRIVFGTMQRLADLSAAPPAPPPFALASEEAMRDVLTQAGFGKISVVRLPLVFKAEVGSFAARFRAFAARAAVILDQQSEAVLQEIFAAWDAQLEEFLVDGEYQVPMPALAVSGIRAD